MDELWQRFRSFWMPVLWGVAAFLVGLVVVHMASDDPEAGVQAVQGEASRIKNLYQPAKEQIDAAQTHATRFAAKVNEWARRLDQRRGKTSDPLEAAVEQSLTAVFLHGVPANDPLDRRAEAFEGDAAAATAAVAKYDALLKDRVNRLRTQDPNVAFSLLKADVVSELGVRCNRADVEVLDEEFGLGQVASVERVDLPRRLLNLALVATVVDVAIREGIRSIDGVSIQAAESRGEGTGGEGFLSEWPVQFDMTGSPQALTAILNLATDPAAPIPLGPFSWKTTGKKDGLVRASFRAYSVLVKPDAVLGLEQTGG